MYRLSALVLALFAATIVSMSLADMENVNAPPKEVAAKTREGALESIPMTPAPSPMLLNVKDFGAVGDGKADDTAALQKAMASAVQNSRTLFLPNGEYRVTSTLDLTNLGGMCGERYMGAILLYEGEGFCLDMRGAKYGCSLQDIGVTCTKKDADGKSLASGILVGNANNQETPDNAGGSAELGARGLRLVGVYIAGAKIGIKIDGGCWTNYYYQLRVQNCDVGIYLGANANSNDFFSPIILYNRIGVQLAGFKAGVHFFGGNNEGNTEKGFYFSGESEKLSVTISGMYFENEGTDIYVNGHVRNLTIRDCYVAGWHQNKQPFFVNTNKFPTYGIAIRDCSVWSSQSTCALLNGSTLILDNSFVGGPAVAEGGTVLVPVYKTVDTREE